MASWAMSSWWHLASKLPPAPNKAAADLYARGAAHDPASLANETAKVLTYVLARDLIDKAHALAAEERFLHWQIAFPRVWTRWTDSGRHGGFDAVIGNPPWDRMKMQEVEWFAARAPEIARQPRAADRKKAITALEASGAPLANDYARARERAETGVRLAIQKGGDYPLLGRGDVNLYSLFVERAQTLIKPSGIAGLLVPSGIASDMTASHFFRSVSTTGRIRALLDFENRRGQDGDGKRRSEFFPDVDSRFKFCAFIVSGVERQGQKALCGFFLTDPPPTVVRQDDEHLFLMDAADFLTVNPNTATAPIFRTRRDAELTKAIYARLPVLVDKSNPGAPVKAWPVEYRTMFHMAGDSELFQNVAELEKEGAYETVLGRWQKGSQCWLPLYEGKMVQAYDHRASDVEINEENLYRPGQQTEVTQLDKADSKRFGVGRFWVEDKHVAYRGWHLGIKDVTAATNMRTMIASIIPDVGAGHTLPILDHPAFRMEAPFFIACLNSLAFDFLCRQKIHTNHLVLYALEQVPVVPKTDLARAFCAKTAEAIVKDHVLRLSYTAWDLEGFARDMGHVGPNGAALAPFIWNEAERRHLRARLDALYFILYGITDEADVRYIFSTFPIVEKKDRAAHNGVYLTAELIIWYMRALSAGDAEMDAPVDVLLRRK